ncbi:MAG: D-lyxose/D-mannose family sugar isomerase [Phycisphaerales bacterium]|nr:D-lyxose/D-mannose family sugar isomerase [Phycisphaerales bacterium]
MITRKEFAEAKNQSVHMVRRAGILLNQHEIDEMDVADFGLNDLMVEGGQMFTLMNTDRVSAKVIALFPGQTLPEHWHTALGEDPGKQETIRVVMGQLYFCQEGPDTLKKATIPKAKHQCYTARNEMVMSPGDQITIEPGTRHWFQAGAEGAVLFSFASSARDALDPFTDPEIVRVTRVID